MKNVFQLLQRSDKVGLIAFGRNIVTQVKMGPKRKLTIEKFDECKKDIGVECVDCVGY